MSHDIPLVIPQGEVIVAGSQSYRVVASVNPTNIVSAIDRLLTTQNAGKYVFILKVSVVNQVFCRADHPEDSSDAGQSDRQFRDGLRRPRT